MKTILLVMLFLGIDQGTKYYVASTFNQATLYIWGDSLLIKPHLNQNMSWINGVLKETLHITISDDVTLFIRSALFVLIVMYLIYHIGIDNRRLDSHYRISLALILSATLASILDQTLWGGSLDWIAYTTQSLKIYAFDLKDLFLDLGLISLIGACLLIMKDVCLKSYSYGNQSIRTLKRSLRPFFYYWCKNELYSNYKTWRYQYGSTT